MLGFSKSNFSRTHTPRPVRFCSLFHEPLSPSPQRMYFLNDLLPKWLSSKNNFNKEIKLTEDIRANTNNVESSSANKKVFDDLDKLINETRKKKTTREDDINKIKNIVSDLDQQRLCFSK